MQIMAEIDSERSLCVSENEVHVCSVFCTMKNYWPFWRAFG